LPGQIQRKTKQHHKLEKCRTTGRYQVGYGCKLYFADSFIRLKEPEPLTKQVTVSVHSVTNIDDTGNEFSAHFIPDGAMEGVERAETHTRSQRPRVLIRM
jgi:hypothetical protein